MFQISDTMNNREMKEDPYRIKHQTLNQLTCPVIVILLAFIVSVVIKETVLKNFSTVMTMNAWPISGKTLFYFANFVEGWWWILSIILFAGGWLLYRYEKRNQKKAMLISKTLGVFLTVIGTAVVANIILGTYAFTQIN